MSGEFKDLLLQDYKYRVEAMSKSEAAGETRVNLFITLITISSGAIGALITKGSTSPGQLPVIVAIAFFALLLVGFVTFLRMIVRNNNTDQCKHQLDLIRRTYQDQLDVDGTWADYELFPGKTDEEKRDEKKRRAGGEQKVNLKVAGEIGPIRARQFGGLPHTVAVLNSLLCAGLVAALLFPFLQDCPLVLAALMLVVIAAALWAQVAYLRVREHKTASELKRDFPRDTHAGGVVYKIESDTAKYLLVSAKGGGDPAFLPKGHIKRGEGHAEAALREVCEETGAVARLQGFVGRAEFDVIDKEGCKKNIRVKFFLMEWLAETLKEDEEEKRSDRWCDYETALKALPEQTQPILRNAERQRLWRLRQPNPVSTTTAPASPAAATSKS